MCSPVLRHVTYIPHCIKRFSCIFALIHYQIYENKIQDAIKKYCSKRQTLNLSCAEENWRGKVIVCFIIASLVLKDSLVYTYKHDQSFNLDYTQFNTVLASIKTLPSFHINPPAQKSKHEVRVFMNNKSTIEELWKVTPPNFFFGPSTFHNEHNTTPGRLFINQRFCPNEIPNEQIGEALRLCEHSMTNHLIKTILASL